jgi:membrane-associated protease RseP (regulator of RpoE activity)
LNLKSQAFNSKVNAMSKISSLVLAGLLVSANALAADSPPAATTTPSPGADLDAQLAAARQKLEAAARDVAQLSAQLGQSAMVKLQSYRTRAVLGLQLQVEPSAKDQGAAVIGVSPGGPAAEAGVVTGDVIVAINGDATTGPNASRDVVEHMATIKPDTKVTLKVMRDGKVREFQVTPRASFAVVIPPLDGPIFNRNGPGGPGGGASFEGVELADLSPALGQYFGTSQGVLVVRVPRADEFLKLQDGDVIQSIDGRVPENGSHATRILRSYQPGEKIHLKVMRQKKSLELEGTLPERRRFGGDDWGPEPGPRPALPAAPAVPPAPPANHLY